MSPLSVSVFGAEILILGSLVQACFFNSLAEGKILSHLEQLKGLDLNLIGTQRILSSRLLVSDFGF